MRLTQHTDYSLRVLIALGVASPEKLTVTAISSAYGISRNHLTKVVLRLAELGYVETVRGKNGGVFLGMRPENIRLGQVIRHVEPEFGLVECLRSPEQFSCVIGPACRLRAVLRKATHEFLAGLDDCTLDMLLTEPEALGRLLGFAA